MLRSAKQYYTLKKHAVCVRWNCTKKTDPQQMIPTYAFFVQKLPISVQAKMIHVLALSNKVECQNIQDGCNWLNHDDLGQIQGV